MYSIFAPLDPDERVPREQLPVRGVGFGEGRIPREKGTKQRKSQRLLELLDARQASVSFFNGQAVWQAANVHSIAWTSAPILPGLLRHWGLISGAAGTSR